MNLMATAQRSSRRTMARWRDEREAKRVARNGAHAHVSALLGEARKRDALRAELATAQARLEVLERMLGEVGEALARYDAAETAAGGIRKPHWRHAAVVVRREALGVLLARVWHAVRFACQTPVVEEKA